MQIEALKANKIRTTKNIKTRDENINRTLKGVLINNHIQNPADTNLSFNDIQDSLLIVDNRQDKEEQKQTKQEKESSFNTNKAIKPLLIGSIAAIGCCLGLSLIFKKSAQLRTVSKAYEQLPDLAINNNIKEEPQFAIYRAIRDPNFTNILGAAAVFIMSGITIASKNFVDGAKEIWIKKQSADVEKELQENLIEVETNSFSGKLNIVNEMMNQNLKYFDSVLNKKPSAQKSSDIFSQFISFKGKPRNEKEADNQQKDNQKDDKNKKLVNNLKYIGIVGSVIAAAAIAGKLSFDNLRKTEQYAKQYADKITENTITLINSLSENPDKKHIPNIIELLKTIKAKPEYIKSVCQKYNISAAETEEIIENVEKSVKIKFVDAPTAIGGIPRKIQYYCYVDENRGHLYNWILNPDNKYTKYIFLSFTLSSAIGYIFRQCMDAIKEVTVLKENAKTELDLKKRLVDVEINNFKSKKESAIEPLIENFTKQADSNTKSKEELKQIADNILTEIKNGPPYVYT